MRSPSSGLVTSWLRGRFLRFAIVGAIGFAVDASVLLALVGAGWAGPIGGRLASFACAVLATFELNRRWSFEGAVRRPYPAMLLAYVGVQGLGFLCNFAIYAAALAVLPPPLNRPLFCLALASGLALAINFAGARLIVFRHRES